MGCMLLLTADPEGSGGKASNSRADYCCTGLLGAGRGTEARVDRKRIPEASGTSVIIDFQPESVVQPWYDRLSA